MKHFIGQIWLCILTPFLQTHFRTLTYGFLTFNGRCLGVAEWRAFRLMKSSQKRGLRQKKHDKFVFHFLQIERSSYLSEIKREEQWFCKKITKEKDKQNLE
jgi:hypothetical protein